jgi:hypothetical protein
MLSDFLQNMVSERLAKFCRHILMEIKMQEKWRTVCISGVTRYVAKKGILPTQAGGKKYYTCDETLFQPFLSLWNHQTNGSESRRTGTVCVHFRTCVSSLYHWSYEHNSKFAKCLVLSNDKTQLVSTWINRSFFLYINVYLIKLQLISPVQDLGPLYWN